MTRWDVLCVLANGPLAFDRIRKELNSDFWPLRLLINEMTTDGTLRITYKHARSKYYLYSIQTYEEAQANAEVRKDDGSGG